jgi:asparagine synthase (glutamine-hydrolysing)
MLQADVVTRLTEHSLMLTDRMTMAHSLEGRCPFLDHELAEFVARLDPHLKMRGRSLKHVMRKASEGLLPPSILRRDKQGFMFPLGYWMKGPLVPVLRHLLDDSALVRAEIFRRDAIRALLDEHLAGRADHHVRLWMLLNVEVWYRLYVLREPMDTVAGTLAERVAQPGGRAARAGAR